MRATQICAKERLVVLPTVLPHASMNAITAHSMGDLVKMATGRPKEAAPSSGLDQQVQFLTTRLGPRFDAASIKQWYTVEFQANSRLNVESVCMMLEGIPPGAEADFFVNSVPSPIMMQCSIHLEMFPPFEMCSFMYCAHRPSFCNECASESIRVLTPWLGVLNLLSAVYTVLSPMHCAW